jgi:UPF0755 protein
MDKKKNKNFKSRLKWCFGTDNKIKVFLSLFLIFAFIFASAIPSVSCSAFQNNNERVKSKVEKGLEVEVEIKEGMTLTQISELLEEKGIIDNALLFKLYVEGKGLEKKLLPGIYVLKTLSEYDVVLKSITSGPEIITFKLIIPEGFTIKQIEERIKSELPFIDKNELGKSFDVTNYNYDFLKVNQEYVPSLEGFLFPKTYEVLQDYTAKNVIEMLLYQYQFETSSLDYSKMLEEGKSQYDILKIASMIEREAYIPEERVLISAVIHNRLNLEMPLGIDATLSYFLDKWDEPLTESDLETDTPYNTRIYKGLPPTPICNPGIESIRAALEPANVDYLYYVVTDPISHKHSFASTLEEHNKNVSSTTTTNE